MYNIPMNHRQTMNTTEFIEMILFFAVVFGLNPWFLLILCSCTICFPETYEKIKQMFNENIGRFHRMYDTVSQSVRHGVTECTTRCQTVHRMASTVFREDAARSAEDSDHYINDGAKEMVHAVRWDSCSRSTSISHIS